jgi:hypothetical protein
MEQCQANPLYVSTLMATGGGTLLLEHKQFFPRQRATAGKSPPPNHIKEANSESESDYINCSKRKRIPNLSPAYTSKAAVHGHHMTSAHRAITQFHRHKTPFGLSTSFLVNY